MPIYMRFFENGVRAVMDGEAPRRGDENGSRAVEPRLGLSKNQRSDPLEYPPIKSDAMITKSGFHFDQPSPISP